MLEQPRDRSRIGQHRSPCFIRSVFATLGALISDVLPEYVSDEARLRWGAGRSVQTPSNRAFPEPSSSAAVY